MELDSLFTRSAKAINFVSGGTPAYDNFIIRYHDWIHSSKQPVAGLPGKRYIVSGVTDAFNQTYGLYNKIGIFDGEYDYHRRVFGDGRVTTDLSQADIIIISHPFSSDGMCAHDKLEIADSFNKPIFVDCAFFGICRDISFDFTPYKNIHSVCFSLSKTFGTGHYRVGLLYTKDNYPVTVYGEWEYPLLSSAEYHYDLLDKLGPDDVPNKYKIKQLDACRLLKLDVSNTIIFGLDYKGRYDAFRRGDVNRLCLTDVYIEMDKQSVDSNKKQ